MVAVTDVQCYTIDRHTYHFVNEKNMSAFDTLTAAPKGSDDINKLIDEIDINGDGQFSREEVREVIVRIGALTESLKNFKMIAALAFVAMIVVSFSMLGITLIGNEISKDQSTSESGLLTVKGHPETPVKVASSDIAVSSDGTLMSRNGPSSTSNKAPPMIRTAPKMTTHELTSRIPDKYLAELRSFMYRNPKDKTVENVQVNSFMRVPELGALCGSVVVLQTCELASHCSSLS